MREIIGNVVLDTGETAVYILDTRTEQVDVVVTRPAMDKRKKRGLTKKGAIHGKRT